MKCVKCGVDLRDGVKFCGLCGAVQPTGSLRCVKCGTELRADAKFCDKCGAAVQTGPAKCIRCGAELRDGAQFCDKCGTSQQPRPTPQNVQRPVASPEDRKEISNYLIESILVTLFCCQLLGIPALVLSAMALREFDRGNAAGARKYSSIAHICSIVGLLGGLLVYLIVFISMAMSGSSPW